MRSMIAVFDFAFLLRMHQVGCAVRTVSQEIESTSRCAQPTLRWLPTDAQHFAPGI